MCVGMGVFEDVLPREQLCFKACYILLLSKRSVYLASHRGSVSLPCNHKVLFD